MLTSRPASASQNLDNMPTEIVVVVVVVLGCFNTPHQQQRSYGDGTSVLRLIRKTGEARSNSRPLVYKAMSLTTQPRRLLKERSGQWNFTLNDLCECNVSRLANKPHQ